jgi:N-acetylmuramoyl-L-alanine amidase
MNNIVGHKDVAVPKGRKTDPAPNFNWNRLRDGIS